VTVFQQGDLQTTRNPLDLAIEGEGFFKVKTPQGTRYTRGGNFRLSKEGVLIQPNGFPVLGRNGEITIKGNSVSVAKDGTIWVDGNNQAKLALVTFSDLNGLQKEGNTLFKLVTDQEEKEADQSQVHEGTLELSNVNSLEEMIRMIDSLRSFQSCYKIVQVQDEMDGKAVNDLAKV
jgi:flagellar basal-body rod protein FlgF